MEEAHKKKRDFKNVTRFQKKNNAISKMYTYIYIYILITTNGGAS